MLRLGQKKVTKEKFYAAKKSINIWDVNTDIIVISESVKTKIDSTYCIGYLDQTIRVIVLIMLKNIELNALPVYDHRYIKTKTRTYDNNIYTNFRGLNVPEDDKQFESFTAISIDSLLVYKSKYYLQVYLGNCRLS